MRYDTPPEALYGQRNIPQVLVKDIREVAADDALFLNYANPMAMNTWAALERRRAHGGPVPRRAGRA